MFSRKIFSIIACSLMLIGISSCATTATKPILQTIDSETIQAVIEDDSRTLPIEPGDEIRISTTKRISISTRNVFYVDMVVKDVNTSRIRGEVDLACCDSEQGKEGITSNIVEVKLEDINRITFIEEQVQAVAKKPPGEKAGKIAAEAILTAITYPIGLAIFLALFIAII